MQIFLPPLTIPPNTDASLLRYNYVDPVWFRPSFRTALGLEGWAGEMAHSLRALAALTKDLGSVLSTHMAAHSHLDLQFQGRQHPLLTSTDFWTHVGIYTYTQVHICTHKIQSKKLSGLLIIYTHISKDTWVSTFEDFFF